jgi:putative transposase
MPRANRYILPGVAYHLTHRCHDRSFLLKHGVDRTLYRQMLRERLGRHPVSLLGYCITSNHTHLLLVAQDSEADISRFMQSLEGDFAQAYNLRKKTRSGAFWGDRYHAVMVDTGAALQNFKPLKKRLTAEGTEDTEVRSRESVGGDSPAD